MEKFIQILIYIHAFLGGLGLLSGTTVILLKKGNKFHKKLGKIFTISLLTSVVLSLAIALMPNHENSFLFLIGVFTIYLVLTGNRALKFKTNHLSSFIDKLLSGIMLICSIIMLSFGVYLLSSNSEGVLFIFFGSFGIFLCLRDFRFYKNQKRLKNAWLMAHIGKMIGAFIASVTAFIVAGIGINTTIAWLLPTLIGTPYIIYWIRKVKV